MKIGVRKPSIKKSIKARTTGRIKRSVKKALIPGYGKKGMGWIKNPKKAAYNKIYNKTTFSLFHLGLPADKKTKRSTAGTNINRSINQYQGDSYTGGKTEVMKVCKFCGTECRDAVHVCPSCGGNEFKNMCGNCGTVYEEGIFCPKCGIKAGTKAKKCPNCGTDYYSNACPECGFTNNSGNRAVINSDTVDQLPKKKKTWLWVLGWIFIFPVPLTILLLRNNKLKKWVKIAILAVAWIIYFTIALGGNSSDPATSSDNLGSSSKQIVSTDSNIKKMTFLYNDDVTIRVGQKESSGYLRVTVKSNSNLSPDDVLFVSDDPQIATIMFTSNVGTFLYYDITAVGAGETYVYATSKDGGIISDKIKISVPEAIAIESISLSCPREELYLHESIATVITYSPSNAEDTTLFWKSSDEAVATVDENGLISSVGSGTATITVSTPKGVSASFEIEVDGTKTVMALKVSRNRQDDINIGDEWSYLNEINGERTTATYILAAGDKLTFYAKYSEDDNNPDVGEASTTHTVTEEDLTNGFTVSMDLYVTENGGSNKGKSAHFIVEYIFTP